MKIAVDAMGGDYAPKAIVEGIIKARSQYPDIEFLLYGDEKAIKEHLNSMEQITIIHTDEKISSDDEPVKAIRRKKTASMVLAAQAVKNGEADACFSAGNTGALLAAGLFIIGRIKHIERPGLLSTMPSLSGVGNGFDFIDMGANADNRPEHLHQYAILGSYYAKNVRGVKNPKVGLLNNGAEATKGSDLTKKVYGLLAEESAINFVGNIEARDIMNGTCDVVVTDGFTGNAVLKSIEGTALSIMKLLKGSILDSGMKGKLGAVLLKDSFKNMKEQLDYSSHGGAILLGLKAPVIKTHGSADPEAVASTIKQIHTMIDSQVVAQLVEYFEENPPIN